jgi:hypothetical protein
MTERHEDLIDEAMLRRSLRLEPDEAAPRFDARAIALAAQRPAITPRTAAIIVATAAALGVAAVAVWSTLLALAPAVANAAMTAAIEIIVAVATLLLPIAEIAQQPAVPLSLIAALGVAILHELRERREHAHATAP